MSANFDFFKAPNNVFELGLNTYQALVYLYLCRCSNNASEAFPSYKTISDKCGMSRNKAVSTVNELVELGLVKKITRSNENTKQSNIYKVNKQIRIPHHGLGVYHDMDYPIPQDGHNKETIYKELEEEEPIYITLPSDVAFINIYLKYFKAYKKKAHPRITEEQLSYIEQQIEHMQSYDLSEEDWEEGVKEHFKDLPAKNNGNIIAFLKSSHRFYDIDQYDRY